MRLRRLIWIFAGAYSRRYVFWQCGLHALCNWIWLNPDKQYFTFLVAVLTFSAWWLTLQLADITVRHNILIEMTLESNERTHKSNNSWRVVLVCAGLASFGKLGLISDLYMFFLNLSNELNGHWCLENIGYIIVITRTCLYNVDPLEPHFYIVKLGFAGVYIISFIFAQKHRLWYLLEPSRWVGSKEYPQSMFWAEKYQNFYLKISIFWVVKFSILNRLVFVVWNMERHSTADTWYAT